MAEDSEDWTLKESSKGRLKKHLPWYIGEGWIPMGDMFQEEEGAGRWCQNLHWPKGPFGPKA